MPTKTAESKPAAAKKPAAEKKAATEKKPAAAKKPAAEKKPKDEAPKDKKKKQFVTPHPDGGWQVKLEGSSRATKRFDRKVDAEKYAKELAEKQGTSYLRQKKDGKMQKKRYD